MDMLKVARLIGLFETAKNIAEVLPNNDVINKVGAVMPLPEETLKEDISAIVSWINAFGKKKHMFLTNEIALIEKLAHLSGDKEAIIHLSCEMEEEEKECIKNNIPKGMKVHLSYEPFAPKAFYPSNGIMIACGYTAGGHFMVLPETFRMIEHYEKGFLGKKIFIPYTEITEPIRYEGWIEVSGDKFDAVWRGAYDE